MAQLADAQLLILRQRLRRIADGGAMKVFTQIAASAIHREATACFTGQRDPYGRAWPARKPPTGTWPLLDKSGAGINSMRVRALSRSVKATLLWHMGFHQGGTRRLPLRRFLPTQAFGLGPFFGPALARVSGEVAREVLG